MRRIILASLALTTVSMIQPSFAQQLQTSAPAPDVRTTTVIETGQGEEPRVIKRRVITSQGNSIQSEGSGAIPALGIEVKESNGIRYLTGGIGDEELSMLRMHESEFNVQLVMTAPGGEYVSQAAVSIADETGKEVFFAKNTGPYFYVNLPPGRYTFEVTSQQAGMQALAVTAPAHGTAKPQVRFNEAV